MFQHNPNFYKAIMDDPEDMQLRLVYADFLEDSGLNYNIEYAELIRIQLSEDRHKKILRERELIKKFKPPHLAYKFINKLEFHRGFIEYCDIYCNWNYNILEDILEKYPIKGLALNYSSNKSNWKDVTEIIRHLRWKFITELELYPPNGNKDLNIIEKLCKGKTSVLINLVDEYDEDELINIIHRLKKFGLKELGIMTFLEDIEPEFYEKLGLKELDVNSWQPLS